MNFLTRLNAISHNVKTDQVPLCKTALRRVRKFILFSNNMGHAL